MNMTVFSVRVEYITRGEGLHDHLLAKDNLQAEVLELMEEGEVPDGQGRDSDGPGEVQ